MTDKPEVLQLPKESIKTNQLENVSVTPLVWGDEQAAQSLVAESFPDLVVFSDCITWPNLYQDLIKTLSIVCGPKTSLIFANEKRSMDNEVEFYAGLGQLFRFNHVDEKLQDPTYQSPDIYMFTARKK